MKSCMLLGLVYLLCACASRHQDHFYVLEPLPAGRVQAVAASPIAVSISVSLPSSVDRLELVVNTGPDGIVLLEHERWAAPLSDLVVQTLAQDLENRRPDLLVGAPGGAASGSGVFKVHVDIVQLTARRGTKMSIAAHWRIVDSRTGREGAGGQAFESSLGEGGYADIAHALSQCLALLADAVAAQMPRAGQ